MLWVFNVYFDVYIYSERKNLRNLIPGSSCQFFVKENIKESFLYQTGVADYEKRTPEVKFRPFLSSFQKTIKK